MRPSHDCSATAKPCNRGTGRSPLATIGSRAARRVTADPRASARGAGRNAESVGSAYKRSFAAERRGAGARPARALAIAAGTRDKDGPKRKPRAIASDPEVTQIGAVRRRTRAPAAARPGRARPVGRTRPPSPTFRPNVRQKPEEARGGRARKPSELGSDDGRRLPPRFPPPAPFGHAPFVRSQYPRLALERSGRSEPHGKWLQDRPKGEKGREQQMARSDRYAAAGESFRDGSVRRGAGVATPSTRRGGEVANPSATRYRGKG